MRSEVFLESFWFDYFSRINLISVLIPQTYKYLPNECKGMVMGDYKNLRFLFWNQTIK